MIVQLYKFAKRENSTKRPTTAGKSFTNVQLKDNCSFTNPTIKFNFTGENFHPQDYNYAIISDFQRYYFITDWTYLNGCWEAALNVDVLASFKNEIANTEAYVIRSASTAANNWNGNIVDSFYPTTVVKSIIKQSISSDIYQTTLANGCYIVGCINAQGANRVGAITYYALTNTEMQNLLTYLFSSNIYDDSGISEISEGLYKSMFDPFQYIVSCMWFPFPATALVPSGTSKTKIKVGYWETTAQGYIARYIIKEIGFKTMAPLPVHPQSVNRGNYLNYSPYTVMTLYYPPFGEIPIDTSFRQFGSNTYLYGKIYIDFITGVADCYISMTDGYDIESTADPYRFMLMRSAQLGVPLQISQVMSDYISTLTNGVGAVSSLFSGNISGVFSNIASAASAAMPKVSSIGANGCLSEIIEPPYLVIEFNQVATENRAEFGRPLCETRTLGTLAGFTKCGESDHSFSGTETENNAINNYLEQGFFYE